MAAIASKPTKPSSAANAVIGCTVLNQQGEACGRPGRADLPAGICDQCAIRVYRAVVALGRAA